MDLLQAVCLVAARSRRGGGPTEPGVVFAGGIAFHPSLCDSGGVEVIIEGIVKEAYLAILAKERGAETLRERRIAVGIGERALSGARRAISHTIPRELLLMFGDSDVFGRYDLDWTKVAERQSDVAQAGASPTLVA